MVRALLRPFSADGAIGGPSAALLGLLDPSTSAVGFGAWPPLQWLSQCPGAAPVQSVPGNGRPRPCLAYRHLPGLAPDGSAPFLLHLADVLEDAVGPLLTPTQHPVNGRGELDLSSSWQNRRQDRTAVPTAAPGAVACAIQSFS